MTEYHASRIVEPGEPGHVFVQGAQRTEVEEFDQTGETLQRAWSTGDTAAYLVDMPVAGNWLWAIVVADGEVKFPDGWTVEFPPSADA